MRTLPLWLAALGLVSLANAPMPAHAETYHGCAGFITSLPATINTQGVWCFNANLETGITNGNAITISTNNVTIDCNDFKLGGLAAGPATGVWGISAIGRLNVTVRNCNIRGFIYGLRLEGGGHLVEDSRFDGNTFAGIYVKGDASLVQRNRVNTTGGSTFVLGTAYGIFTEDSVDVLENSVDGVAPAANGGGNGNAYGINTEINLSGSLIGNRVRGLVPLGTGVGYGIHNNNSGRISMRRNDLVGPGTAGLRCSSVQARAKDNIVNGFPVGLQFCGDAGGNDITF